jgi:hypothetical protein
MDTDGMALFIRVYPRPSVVQFLVATRRAGHFEPFRGKSIQVPLHEPFTRQTKTFKSTPIKPNQT